MRILSLLHLLTFLCIISFTANSQSYRKVSSTPPTIIKNEIVGQPKTSTANRLPGKIEKCGFAYIMNQAKAKGFNEQAYETFMRKLIEKRKADGISFRGQAVVTVPVVFHVIFRNGQAEGGNINISQARINAQIQQLNEDYANLSGSVIGAAADMQIQFCAALVDPYGRTLAQPGIDRINGQTKGWINTGLFGLEGYVGYFNATIKPASIWDPYSYLNVWTADATNTGGLLGFATFPGLSTLSGLDDAETDLTAGVVIAPGTVGSKTMNGTTAPYNFGRTLTHEAGHFFGLRHIWGDANCGEDYCADTPTQDMESTSCVVSPSPTNCNPFENRMFENYMDYTNDACLNTFTTNQSQRASTVMTNSPRRSTLPSSAACATRAANSIQFPILSTAVPETNNNNTACPFIRNKVINVGIAGAATGAATVTFNLAGTASNNADYTISPASITYTNGDNAIKSVTITIIDDNAVETNETIQLSYTITGSGVVAGPDRQVCTITIADDDFDREVDDSGPITLLNENFNSSTDFPTDWVAFEGGVNEWTISANGGNGTSGNAAHITEDVTLRPNTYDETATSESYLITPLIDATGLVNINLSFKWRGIGEYDGTHWDAGQIGIIWETDPNTVNLYNTYFDNQTGPDPTAANFNLTLVPGANNNRFWIAFYWFNDNNTGEDPPFTVDDVVVTGQPVGIESTVIAGGAFPINSAQTTQYISPNYKLFAKLEGLNENVGCITPSVQNSGIGLTAINTGTGSFFRSDKVIKLTPATPTTTASYQVTLYYTTAELAAWGGSVGTLKMMKVKDGVNLAGIVSTANAVIANATVDDQRATKGYAAFTSTFTDGFSQFMLVSPLTTLPINLLTFEAKTANRSIFLNWSTAQEVNNKGFGIERSEDGVNYKNIGWVNGRINSSDRSDYSYQDNFVQPGIIYYYRLRQTDLDAREKLSMIRQAKLDKAGLAITLSPNPAKGRVSLFISGRRQLADVSLLNGHGQVVRTWKKLNASDLPAVLDVAGLSAGLYLVNINLPGEKRVEKLLIE